ncbi:MAG TPA: hypothetical protein VN956_06565 [Pyrinomonadaceae bacterium]|nr:hypothetical protein [Pyrinomonadaceae bacterium]
MNATPPPTPTAMILASMALRPYIIETGPIFHATARDRRRFLLALTYSNKDYVLH